MKAALMALALSASASAYTLSAARPPLAIARPAARTAAPPAMLAETDQASWFADVESTDKLAVVFFYAPWCRACKAALPKLQRIEKRYADEVSFFQVNFKAETELCYSQRVLNFPTVHFYLPGVGRVAGGELTAANADEKMSTLLERLLRGRSSFLYKRLRPETLGALVQYTELVSALQGLAEVTDARRESDARLAERRKEAEARIRRTATEYGLRVTLAPDPTFEPSGVGALALASSKERQARLGTVLGARQEAARLRGLVEGDGAFVGELERLFGTLDADDDGLIALGGAEARLAAGQEAWATPHWHQHRRRAPAPGPRPPTGPAWRLARPPWPPPRRRRGARCAYAARAPARRRPRLPTAAGLDAALAALQPEAVRATAREDGVVARLSASLAAPAGGTAEGAAGGGGGLAVNSSVFTSLMVDKRIGDLAAGDEALLPAFQALDAEGAGVLRRAQLVGAIEHFCAARPGAPGCAAEARAAGLGEAFDAYADGEGEAGALDYDGFVELVSCRRLAVGAPQAAAAGAAATAASSAADAGADALATVGQPPRVQTIVRVAPAPAPPAEVGLLTKCLHEAVGTALIVTGGSAGVASLLGPTATAAVWASAVGTAVASFAGTSGAHFNPAVTLALAVDGQARWRDAPAYLAAQLLGALAASYAVVKLAAEAIALPTAAASVGAEAFLSGLLVFACFLIGDFVKEERLGAGAVPLLVGGVIFAMNILWAHLGAAFNPAMAVAPRLVAALLGGWGAPALAGARAYILGSVVGGVLGAKLFARLTGNKVYDKVCSWICAEGPK